MKYYLAYLILFSVGCLGVWLPRKVRIPQRLSWALFWASSLLMVFYLWAYTIPNSNYIDFTGAYHDAGGYVLNNRDALYRGKLPEFVNIPLVGFLFSPFAWLEEGRAVQVLLVFSVIALGASLRVLLRAVGTDEVARRGILWLFASSGPLFYSLKLGNLTHFLLPCLLYILVRYRSSPILAGAMSGFCAIIKLPLLLVGLYYVARGRWRLALGFWATLAVAGVASLAIFGLDLHLRWYTETIGRYSGKVIGAYNVQSIAGFLMHLAPGNRLFTWIEVEYGTGFLMAKLLLAAGFTAIVGFGVWRLARAGGGERFQQELCAVICLALLLSPVSWIHYFLLLLPFGAIFLSQNEWRFSSGGWSGAWLLAALFLLALPVFHALPGKLDLGNPALNYFVRHVLVSHYFFGGVLLLLYALFREKEDAVLRE